MIPPRKHIAIAIDGGGAKGLIVAQGLAALEKELTGDRPLIEYPGLNIMVGTSTGSIIAACLAIGMRAQDIVQLYIDAGTHVFPALFPQWVPRGVRLVLTAIIGLLRPSLYPNAPFITLVKETLQKYGVDPDITMTQVGERCLRPDQSIVITTVEISSRRTHFLKTYGTTDAHTKLWEAVLESSSAPTIFPVYMPQGMKAYFTDGGVGTHGNPAYIAAQEAVIWNKYDPKDVTLFSFGTGWLNPDNFVVAAGVPSDWNILDWAENAPNVIIEDVARSESIDIINDYVRLDNFSQGMDFRRFQVLLDKDFDAFAAIKDNNDAMIKVGDQLGQRILNDQHAFSQYPDPANPAFDPEGLTELLLTYQRSVAAGGADKSGK